MRFSPCDMLHRKKWQIHGDSLYNLSFQSYDIVAIIDLENDNVKSL